MTNLSKSKEYFLFLAILSGILTVWSLISVSSAANATFVPSPLTIMKGALQELESGRLIEDIIASLFRVSSGYLLGVVTAIPFGLWLGYQNIWQGAFLPFINFFRNLSPLTWIPFAILWFGIGDLPAALASKSIDAYFVGEPFAAKAELDGTGRVLYHAKDIWKGFISCVLVVHEKLIRENPEMVKELVRGIAASGEWAEYNREKAAQIVAPFFRQDQKVIRYVLPPPPDRVSYRMLTPTVGELQKIHDMGIKTGILQTPVSVTDILDNSFIPPDIKPADIE